MKRSKKLTTLMAALSVFALTGCDLTNLGLGSLTKPFENFSILDLVDPFEWFHKKEDKKDDEVAVTSVTLSSASIALKVNQEKTLTATVLPENATNKAVTWASTDAQVASVTNGKVKGLKAGTAKIKATAGGKTAECSVVVTEASGDDDPDEIVEITKVNAPETIEQNGTLATTQVTLEVELADGSVKNDVHPEEIVLDTSNLGEVEGTVKIAGLSATFTIEVVTGQVVPPVTDIITPQQAMALMDAAGEEVVVSGARKVKGVVAANSKYDSQYKQWTTGFDGVDNFKLMFADPSNLLNGQSPDGMEVVVEGYLEKYQGKYQLARIPAAISPTGEAVVPTLISAQSPQHEGTLTSITVSNNHREFFVGGTFVGETVTAHYSDGATATVNATFTGYNLANEGTQTVTVSYTEKDVTKTTTYSITVSVRSGHAGTLEDPLTSTEAAQIASTLAETTDSKNPIAAAPVYVKGIVTEMKEAFNASYGNYSIVIGGDFTLWRIKNGEGFAKFNSGDIEVGDEVTAYVYIMNYNGTPESTSQSYVVNVKKAANLKTLQSIEIVGSMSKTSYKEGEAYSTNGLTVKGTYDDGSSETVAGTITFNKTAAAMGDTTITATASFGGKTATKDFTVTVTAAPELSSITIEGALTKTSYAVGAAYSADGLTVAAHYADGSQTTVAATITLDKVNAALGDTKIKATATFNGKTAEKEFDVTVTEQSQTGPAVRYEFPTASADASAALDDGVKDNIAAAVKNGTDLVSAATSVKCYVGVSGLKFGSSSVAGSLTITTSAPISKIVVGAITFKEEQSKMSVAGTEFTLTTTMTDYTVEFASPTTNITIEGTVASKGRFYIGSIELYQ